MAERLKAPVLKTGNGATRSGVRIPPPPQLYILIVKKGVVNEELVKPIDGFNFFNWL